MDLLMNLLFVSDQTLRSWNLRNNCGINFFLEVFDFLLHVLDEFAVGKPIKNASAAAKVRGSGTT